MKIRPVLMKVCFKCHGGKKTKNNLKFDSLESLIIGGDTGPALIKGNPGKSIMIQVLKGVHEELDDMPPKESLSPEVIEDFVKWIEDGAIWPESEFIRQAQDKIETDHWAYLPRKRPVPPPAANEDLNFARYNGIDDFLIRRFQDENVNPGKKADKRILIRRAYFDLWGLPPSIKEVTDFEKDEDPKAWSNLIERLLSDEKYGERWGRHWLDVVRYADTAGDATDMPVVRAYLYRDYVIDSFNKDVPYDMMIKEQIAGDIMAMEDPDFRARERMTATGMIAVSRRFNNGPYSDMHKVVANTVETVGKATMGLALECARCHDHKFDPISTEDFYRIAQYFNNVIYPHPGTEHGRVPHSMIPLTPDKEIIREFAKDSIEVAELGKEIYRLRKDLESEEGIKATKRLAFINDKYSSDRIYGVVDKYIINNEGTVLLGGDRRRKGKSIMPGFIDVLGTETPVIPPKQSGRLQLAEWITSEDHPLTARVMVNRIWQHHFGNGIVRTPDLFSVRGERPSHPLLLDWLANRFIDRGWSIKEMHRLIMSSAAYRRSSEGDPRNLAIDPANHLLWRYESKRHDIAVIRDSLLKVSGLLDNEPGGKHPFPAESDFKAYSQHNPFRIDYDHNKRSVYLMRRRLGHHPMLKLFDAPDSNVPVGKRNISTVPTQALFCMNSPFMKKNAEAFAKQLLHYKNDDRARVQQAYEIAYQRLPNSEEEENALEYLKSYRSNFNKKSDKSEPLLHPWTSFCRVLLGANEFFYVD